MGQAERVKTVLHRDFPALVPSPSRILVHVHTGSTPYHVLSTAILSLPLSHPPRKALLTQIGRLGRRSSVVTPISSRHLHRHRGGRVSSLSVQERWPDEKALSLRRCVAASLRCCIAASLPDRLAYMCSIHSTVHVSHLGREVRYHSQPGGVGQSLGQKLRSHTLLCSSEPGIRLEWNLEGHRRSGFILTMPPWNFHGESNGVAVRSMGHLL